MSADASGLQQVLSKSYSAEQVVQAQHGGPAEDQQRAISHMQQAEEEKVRKAPPSPRSEGGKVEEREGDRRGKGGRKGKEGKRDKGVACKGKVLDILA